MYHKLPYTESWYLAIKICIFSYFSVIFLFVNYCIKPTLTVSLTSSVCFTFCTREHYHYTKGFWVRCWCFHRWTEEHCKASSGLHCYSWVSVCLCAWVILRKAVHDRVCQCMCIDTCVHDAWLQYTTDQVSIHRHGDTLINFKLSWTHINSDVICFRLLSVGWLRIITAYSFWQCILFQHI